MKYCTKFHIVAIFSVILLLLCADSLGNTLSVPQLVVAYASVLGGAVLLWRLGESRMYYENKRILRRRRHDARKKERDADPRRH